jgi:hypothetical protein
MFYVVSACFSCGCLFDPSFVHLYLAMNLQRITLNLAMSILLLVSATAAIDNEADTATVMHQIEEQKTLLNATKQWEAIHASMRESMTELEETEDMEVELIKDKLRQIIEVEVMLQRIAEKVFDSISKIAPKIDEKWRAPNLVIDRATKALLEVANIHYEAWLEGSTIQYNNWIKTIFDMHAETDIIKIGKMERIIYNNHKCIVEYEDCLQMYNEIRTVLYPK